MPVAGAQITSFNGVEFAKYINSVRDSQYGPSFVAHRIPHRNGAKQEQTGNLPFRVEYDLEFAGLEWANNARTVIGAMIQKPRGPLVHHLYGKLRAVLKGPISGSWDPVNRGTHYAVKLLFEEDTLTNNLSFERTPSGVSDDLGTAATQTDTSMASYVNAIFERFTKGAPALRTRSLALAAQVAMSSFTADARAYAGSALTQFTSGQITPELTARLTRLPTGLEAATLALRPIETLNSYGSAAIDSAEVTLRQARNLDQAIRANLPPPIEWTVQQQTTLFRLVGYLYPTRTLNDKITLFQNILATNRLSRPDALYPGQVLIVPAP